MREFQQNSSMATMMARASPHSSTTNTPPMFCTLSGCAFESLLLSCGTGALVTCGLRGAAMTGLGM